MNKQKTSEQQEKQRPIRDELVVEVLKGATSVMDEDSLNAAAALLLEVETNKALIHLLQTGALTGGVDKDGKVQLRIEAGCDCSTKAKTA